MDALVEVHTSEELERAVAIGGEANQVNNRDLQTFNVSTKLPHSLLFLYQLARWLVKVGLTRLQWASYDAWLQGFW